MKIDPRHLEMLSAIVEKGGLSEGAAYLGRSQPSVSRTLADLESRLGRPLFEPGRRPLAPTELGRMLAAHGADVARAGRAASAALSAWRQGRSGGVRLAGTPFFMDGVISTLLPDFQRQNPAVMIDQSYGYGEDLYRDLSQDLIDLAVCPVATDQPPQGLAVAKLMPGRNVIVGRGAHPLFRKRSPTLDDLRGCVWIAPPRESPLYSDLAMALAGLGVENARFAYSGGSLSSVLNFLISSDTLTVLPFSVVFVQRRQFDLRAARIRINHPARDLCLVENPAAESSPAVDRLKRHIATTFATLARTLAHHETNSLWKV